MKGSSLLLFIGSGIVGGVIGSFATKAIFSKCVVTPAYYDDSFLRKEIV